MRDSDFRIFLLVFGDIFAHRDDADLVRALFEQRLAAISHGRAGGENIVEQQNFLVLDKLARGEKCIMSPSATPQQGENINFLYFFQGFLRKNRDNSGSLCV